MFFFQNLLKRKSVRWIWSNIRYHRQFVVAIGLLLLTIALHALLFYYFETAPGAKNATITLFDSFWVTMTTLTTVGYGDISAATVGGRWVTIVLGYMAGLSLFAWVAGEVISRLLEEILKRRRGMVKKMRLVDHYLIVNFPCADKVRLMIKRLREDERTELTPIVIISDTIEMLPFEESRVRFIHGSVTNASSYERANVAEASQAIILASDHEDPSCDAITAAAVSIIESLNPDIRTVAECVFEEHVLLFRHVKCDQIVLAGDMLVKLLIQETTDESAARAISHLLEPAGNELYSLPVGPHASGRSFREVAWTLMNELEHMLPVGYKRGAEVELNPPRDLKLEADDILIVMSPDPPKWEQLPKKYFSEK